MKTLQYCPICSIQVDNSPRYLNYICEKCCQKATDKNGRRLNFFNIDLSGGFKAVYIDNGEELHSHICFIEAIKCHADEAKFGGIVIEPIK